MKQFTYITIEKKDCIVALKGTAPWWLLCLIWKILINHEFWYQFRRNRLKNVEVMAFEYLQMDSNGSGHIVGLVTSLSLIKYA